jgi:hypothetical protein
MPGSAGTFENASWAFSDVTLAAGAASASSQIALTTTDIKVYHNITKTRGYVFVRWNSNASFSTVQGGGFFIGVPDEIYINPAPRRAVIFTASNVNTIQGNDNPYEVSIAEGTAMVSYTHNILMSAKNPDSLNRLVIYPLYYGISAFGRCGLIDLFMLPSTSTVADGDTFIYQGIEYDILKIANAFAGIATGNFVCVPI